MAMQMSVDLKNGTPVVPEAYIRIQSFRGDKYGVVVSVGMYASKDSYATGKKEICQSRDVLCPITVESPDNFIAQAYAHLKTLPEFADATDC